jgi:hypothetical protein
MNKRKVLFFVPAVCLALLFSGCATLSSDSTSQRDQFDYRYMNAVEQQASKLAVDVIWVNPPKGRTKVVYEPIDLN